MGVWLRGGNLPVHEGHRHVHTHHCLSSLTEAAPEVSTNRKTEIATVH